MVIYGRSFCRVGVGVRVWLDNFGMCIELHFSVGAICALYCTRLLGELVGLLGCFMIFMAREKTAEGNIRERTRI